MKLAAVSSLLAAGPVYSIYNMQTTDRTETSLSLSWEDHNLTPDGEEPTFAADYYQVVAVERATQAEAANEETLNLSVDLADLQPFKMYDITISGMNATSSEAISSNRMSARTNGQGASVSSTWDSGAQGDLFWNIPSTPSCGTGVEFTVPCATNDLISLGVGENVHVLSSTNTTMRIRVSHKAGLDHINWVSFGEACDWADFSEDMYVVSEFAAYEETVETITPTAINSWSNGGNGTVNQVIIDLPESSRADCSPSVEVRLDGCEASFAHGGWSMATEFVTEGGSTVISGRPGNDYITQVGVAYSVDAECGAEPEVVLSYSVPLE